MGGGIAGLSAACVLAEKGVRVTLLEATDRLGGRVASWPVTVDGQETAMSRGFHAFFRQYYNLRALLRRTDPDLSRLKPVEDYPLLAASGARDSFTHVPRTPPWSILGFVAQSPSFTLRDLAKVNVREAMGLLRVSFPRTFSDLDGMSASSFLDSLNFPESARHLALEVFARSFFADPDDFSAGELVAMFHTYFLGSAEGLLFDVAEDDFDTALWKPLGEYLTSLGVDIRLSSPVTSLTESDSGGLLVNSLAVDGVVLATDRAPLQRIVSASPWLGDDAWRSRLLGLEVAPPFVVWRRWLSCPAPADAAAFLGTSGFGPLDNVSFLEQLESGAAAWASSTGGCVVEMHAYAVPASDAADREQLQKVLWEELLRIHPSLGAGEVRGEEWLVREDCPLVGLDEWASRPGVVTPDERVVLAGDGVRCELPVALMERAATTGTQAGAHFLAAFGVASPSTWTPPMGGVGA
ncbi:FAD-dependent oxidoreductase [Nocardioides sp. BSK12Z-4]|uniref:FAD-dependent oxidoreductase n=1 Tax=Nocardioides bruguierae TaxID=2945102 RepID=A0A9X2D9H5_9ACTN|nr:FAD-dependent oxidoreductase [Nocardioides bruguierae]